jgi:fructoselysine 6-kinase
MKILALGTSCVDVYPQKEIITPGGEALNVAAQLSNRTDVQVFLMGMIGNDIYADHILRGISRFAINTEYLYQVEGQSAHHVIHIDKQGDRYFENGAWHGGVSMQLSFNDKDLALLQKVDAVITTLWEPNLSKLLEEKTDNNYIVAVDFNQQRDFTPWEEHFARIDIFFSSAEESMKATFHQRSKSTDTIYVLTFGEYGSTAYHHGEVFQCDAIKVEQVIDTTGCGDCYQGHFVAEYLKTGDLKAAMQRGAIEASKVTGYVGGLPSK